MTRRPILKYRRQKRSSGADSAFVEVDGRRVYLGPYNTPESREAYARLIAELEVSGGRLPVASADITITELVARYWTHAESYYCGGEHENLRPPLRTLTQLYGRIRAADFGPVALRAVRQSMIDRKLSRGHINGLIGKIRRVLRWAVSEQLIEPSVLQALEAVPGLKRGRTEARETSPVQPAPEKHIEAARPFRRRQVGALVDLQRLTAARPGELFIMRPIDVNTSGPVWTYTPERHKNAHRGHKRTIYIGPRGQDVIRPFLAGRAVNAYMFSPRESVDEYHAERGHKRKTPASCGNTPGSNRADKPQWLNETYNRRSYGQAIRRACDLAGVPRWHAHQLRHTAASKVREEFDLETVRLILGHSRIETAQIYAEIGHERALEVVQKIG